jgi:hypothetical protein
MKNTYRGDAVRSCRPCDRNCAVEVESAIVERPSQSNSGGVHWRDDISSRRKILSPCYRGKPKRDQQQPGITYEHRAFSSARGVRDLGLFCLIQKTDLPVQVFTKVLQSFPLRPCWSACCSHDFALSAFCYSSGDMVAAGVSLADIQLDTKAGRSSPLSPLFLAVSSHLFALAHQMRVGQCSAA